MIQWSQDQVFEGLKKLVPEIRYLKKINDGSIWTSGEDSCIFNGLPPFDYNVEYGELSLSDAGFEESELKNVKVKEMYVNGIHKEIHRWLEKRGWSPKWEDAGTLFFCKFDTRFEN